MYTKGPADLLSLIEERLNAYVVGFSLARGAWPLARV
jgi:hypothetical protein